MNFKELANEASKATAKRKGLDIREEKAGAVTVLKFDGDLDIKTLPKAKALLDGLLGDGAKPAKAGTKAKAAKAPEARLQLVIDLAKVEYIDSSGLGFFIGSLKKVRERKGDLKLSNLNAYMMGIFKLINMHYILEIHENLDKAIKSYSSPRRTSRAGKE